MGYQYFSLDEFEDPRNWSSSVPRRGKKTIYAAYLPQMNLNTHKVSFGELNHKLRSHSGQEPLPFDSTLLPPCWLTPCWLTPMLAYPMLAYPHVGLPHVGLPHVVSLIVAL